MSLSSRAALLSRAEDKLSRIPTQQPRAEAEFLLAAALGAYGGLCAYAVNRPEIWEDTVVLGQDLGGLTVEDAAARLGCLHDAEAMLLEDGALAPLYTTVTAWTLREDYAGVRRDSRGWFDFTAAVPRGE